MRIFGVTGALVIGKLSIAYVYYNYGHKVRSDPRKKGLSLYLRIGTVLFTSAISASNLYQILRELYFTR